jgi:hypothetical protein
MKMAELFTREKAEDGIKIPIFTRTGEPTDQWLIVRGVLSSQYRQASDEWERRWMRSMVEETIDPKAERKPMRDPRPATLVKAWSLEDECTPEAVAALMWEAPQIADVVMGVAADRKRFYGSAPPSTSTGSEPNASSTESPPQDQVKP